MRQLAEPVTFQPQPLGPLPKTVALTLSVPDPLREPLIAELADLGFDAFEETDDALRAYIPAPGWDAVAREAVDRWIRGAGLASEAITEEVIEDQNWNETWEKSIQPIEVGPFIVAPTWAEVPDGGRTVLRIDPKMAFGTGYHETTRLALKLLADRVPEGARVLDVGTGTGILAIATLLRGASSAVGVDIDPWSVTNGRENAALNGVADRFEVREGSVEAVPETGFTFGIANIIRSILQPLLPEIAARLVPEAPFIVGGLLQTERDTFVDALAEVGYQPVEEATENEWWSAECRRVNDEG
ncbi:MAG: 50S ribosomal protein L11 methyltransferase [Rubricoccaceae bacterium]